MGRRNRRNRGGNKNKRQRTHTKGQRDNYVATVVQHGNFKFEAYYAAQGMHDTCWKKPADEGEEEALVPCAAEEKDAERKRWRASICEILPASFRIGRNVPDELRDQMEAELTEILKTAHSTSAAASTNVGSNVAQGEGGTPASDADILPEQVVRRLAFHPHAFQLTLDRGTIRRHARLQPLHEWLKRQTDQGHVTRQETVSMLPPVVLNVDPSDRVLDMCAAPGSKTSQLLEELSQEGCLVANDSSRDRAYMLVHQLRRIMASNPNCLVTCCDAQFFPGKQEVAFDKILCDVPCSGDGTSRKNIGIWKQWSQMAALGLHKLQLDIAWKGVAHLLKDDCGLMCYSTCSYNPTENEAVVAELLRRAPPGSLELVDVRAEALLGEFQSRPGWSSWKVFCEDASRREMKDYDKKNNSVYMQVKRKEWGDKKASADKTTSETSKKDDNDVPEANGGDTADAASVSKKDAPEEAEASDKANPTGSQSNGDSKPPANGDKQANGDGKKDWYEEELSRTFKSFEPANWEDETIMKMAEEAGLVYIPSLADVPKKHERRCRPSCFPPTAEEAERFHLDRCIRCLPHDNDTGGFFVALLRKTAPIPFHHQNNSSSNSAKKEAGDEMVVAEEDVSNSEGPEPKKARVDGDDGAGSGAQGTATATSTDLDGASEANKDEKPPSQPSQSVKGNLLRDKDGKKSNPELGNDDFVPVADELMLPLIEYYGLSEDFPRDLFMTRASGDAKVIYYIGRPVKELIDVGLQKRVTVINSGLKGFVRNNKDCDCRYRIAQEGVHFVAQHMNEQRKIVVEQDDFVKCMNAEPIALTGFSKSMQDRVRPLSVGSFIVVLQGFEDEYHRKMMMTMWRCRGDNITALVNKVDLAAMRQKVQATNE